MNETMNFSSELQRIKRLFDKKEYTPGARECVVAVEQALRQVDINRDLTTKIDLQGINGAGFCHPL